MNTNYVTASAVFTIAWNGYMWVGGKDVIPTLTYSYDGINWLFSTTNQFDGATFGITWNGRIWVAVGFDTSCSIKYSYDGINWNNTIGAFSGINGRGYGVAWNGKMFVAVGFDSAAPNIRYSYDGINWYSNTTNAFSGTGFGIAWNGAIWVAVGSGGSSIRYSYNGINWQNVSSGAFTSLGVGIAYSSPLTPDISSRGLNMYLQSQPVFLSSTNQILATSSTIVMNNTLYVDKEQNRVGINVAPNANYTLDVNGSARITNLTAPQINTSSILASTLTSFYTYSPVIQTSSILASTILAPQIATSSMVASTVTSFYTATTNLQTSRIIASTIFVPPNRHVKYPGIHYNSFHSIPANKCI